MPEVAGKSVSTNDSAVLGAGALFLLFSFFPFYGASVSGGIYSASASENAWHGAELLAILLMIVAVAVVAVRVFGTLPTMPAGPRLVTLAAAGIAAVITVIRVLTLKHGSGLGVSYGAKYGAWILVITSIVATVFAFLAFRESGETLPTAGGSAAPPPPSA